MATTQDARLSRPIDGASGLGVLGAPDTLGEIYEVALTHRSYAFEQPRPTKHNERLEFLGDAVLGLVVTNLIYRRFPDLTEGDMARLRAAVVNTTALAGVARSIGLGSYIKLGKGEEASGGHDKASLLADTLEAVIGAVYLDRGLGVLDEALTPLLGREIDKVISAGGRGDPKTELQETSVRESGEVPVYRVTASGPDHDKSFTAEVFVRGRLSGSGTGRSKKEAEQEAARRALEAEAARFGGAPDARAS